MLLGLCSDAHDNMDLARGAFEEAGVDAVVHCGEYDCVVRGHTHERTCEERGGTVHVNPGGLPFPDADDAYHVAILDTDADATADGVTFRAIAP